MVTLSLLYACSSIIENESLRIVQKQNSLKTNDDCAARMDFFHRKW